MKNWLMTMLLIGFVYLNVNAEYNIVVFAEEGEKFWLVINGIRQNQDPESNVKVTGLNAPNYKAKVIFEDKLLGDLDKNLFMTENSVEMTYNVRKNKKGEYVLKFVSSTPLAKASPPSPEQDVVVISNTNTPVVTKTVTTMQTTTTTANDNLNVDVNVGGIDIGMNVKVNDGLGNTGEVVTSNTTTTTTTTTHPGPKGPAGVAEYHPGYKDDNAKVFWNNKWYDATIKDYKDGKWFIHYDGWSDSWDEWVGSDRIKFAWNIGQSIKVEWNGMWYNATIMELGDGKYKIHYDGWGNQYDEWVGTGRMKR